jgi:uroporphyrinogen decarboxylase
MTRRERVQGVLNRRKPDHPPVSFWHHFTPEQATGTAAVEAHVGHLEKFDLDFLKVMNDHEYPRREIGVVQSVADLRKVKALPGDHGEFAGQLDVLRQLRRKIGDDILTATTVFNTWAVLRKLVAPPDPRHGPPKLKDGEDARDRTIARLLKQDRAAVKAALEAIGASLASFAGACIAAGATGVFLSVRRDWVNDDENGQGTYDEMVRSTDLQILTAAANAPFNMLHVCGRPGTLEPFADYPASVINWADRAAGPSITEAKQQITKMALAGGVENLKTLPEGKPEDVASEVRDALKQAGERPILITPGCTYDPKRVSEDNLKSIVSTARGG